MKAPRKDETLRLLWAVVDETAPAHSADGWFCAVTCNTECGATIDSLCACCLRAMTALVDARSDGEPV